MSVITKDLGAATAYAYAVEKGYTGTEEEFAELMASYATVGQTAVTAVTAATTKASEASTSATNAAGSASSAASSATAASGSATSAAASATTASGKASEATTAATTATTAKTDAVTAKTAAETAQTAAETAQAAAEDAQTAAEEAAEQAEATLESYAKVDGSYEDMTAGTAEQLISDKFTEDSVPYHFRKTGGDGADREYDQIVGGTVGWNQRVRNGNFESTTDWSVTENVTSFTVADNIATVETAAATDNTYLDQYNHEFVSGHKYLICAELKVNSLDGNPYFNFATYPSVSGISVATLSRTTNWEHFTAIKAANGSGTSRIRVGARCGIATAMTYQMRNTQLFDLTALFGSTIADYIDSLETANAGAGVAWFKKLFPNDYYAYSAAGLESVKVSGHKTVGFNAFDGEWQTGLLLQNGSVGTSETTRKTTKNYIKLVPNETYCMRIPASGRGRGAFYDANKNLISYYADFPATGNNAVFPNNGAFVSKDGAFYFIFVAPTTACWLKYCPPSLNLTKICINISDPTKNGTYEPYKAHSYPLDSSLTLRGVPQLVDGKIKWDGDVYDSDGTVTRKYGIVDLGTLNWDNGSYNNFVATLSDMVTGVSTKMPNILTTKFVTIIYANRVGITEPCITIVDASKALHVRNSNYSSKTDFKAAMSGVYLVYELATPTTETADPYTNPQICDAGGTEEFVSTGIVPVGHNTKYPDNMRAKLDGLPWNFASLIAPTESGYTATRNYTTGALLIVNNVLYKATANIANGGTITPNTNVTATTLAEIIAALS